LWVVGRGHTFTEWGLHQVCPLKAPAPYSTLLLPGGTLLVRWGIRERVSPTADPSVACVAGDAGI
jgi:hypothetical protein